MGKKNSTNKISRKKAGKIVEEKLASALAEYKGTIKEKKFRSKLKKAGRLFAADVAKSFNKQETAEPKKVDKQKTKKVKIVSSPRDQQAEQPQ
jgi:hypothetical protein